MCASRSPWRHLSPACDLYSQPATRTPAGQRAEVYSRRAWGWRRWPTSRSTPKEPAAESSASLWRDQVRPHDLYFDIAPSLRVALMSLFWSQRAWRNPWRLWRWTTGPSSATITPSWRGSTKWPLLGEDTPSHEGETVNWSDGCHTGGSSSRTENQTHHMEPCPLCFSCPLTSFTTKYCRVSTEV